MCLLGTYRTVRACSSTGAPESTAAGVSTPGSLPSMTRRGTGEKLLYPPYQHTLVWWFAQSSLRCSVVDSDIPIRLVSGLSLRCSFLSDSHTRCRSSCSWCGVGRLWAIVSRLLVRGDRIAALEARQSWSALRQCWPDSCSTQHCCCSERSHGERCVGVFDAALCVRVMALRSA